MKNLCFGLSIKNMELFIILLSSRLCVCLQKLRHQTAERSLKNWRPFKNLFTQNHWSKNNNKNNNKHQQPSVDPAKRRHGRSLLSEEWLQSRTRLYVPAPLASPTRKSRGNAGDPDRSSGLADTQVKYQLRCCRRKPCWPRAITARRVPAERPLREHSAALQLRSHVAPLPFTFMPRKWEKGDKNGIPAERYMLL